MISPIAILVVVLTAIVVAKLPSWLPRVVVGLRKRAFTAVNGREGIAIPGDLDVAHFEPLYTNPATRGRSRGAALSDLFWYWLAPGPELHQEHLEDGPRYDEVAAATRRILAVPKARAEEMAMACAERVLDERAVAGVRAVRLRDEMMPIWAELYFEIVFGVRPTAAERALVVANANDVVTSLKGSSLRHLDRRDRLTRFLEHRIASGAVPHLLPPSLSVAERALVLQGVFFNTAIVQSSEAMAHVLLALAENTEAHAKLLESLEDDRALDRVVTETFRMFPLFGVAHRITTAPIVLEGGARIASGSVLCFDYAAYQRAGYDDPDRFDPDRWLSLSPRDASYIPFGVAENRPCPAQALALITIRAVTRAVLRRYALASSVEHTRSIPNRAPCLFIPRSAPLGAVALRVRLAVLQLRDRWENVGRSLVQLVLGTSMVLDARKQALCRRYFEREPSPLPPRATPTAPPGCPFSEKRRTS
jgi:hypothetical protein